MEILNQFDGPTLRQKYKTNFINLNSEEYVKNIEALHEHKDGLCYSGYLWDYLQLVIIKSEKYCKNFLKQKNSFYIFWDIHSCEKILVPNYWKYPKDAMLCVNYNEFMEICNNLPEDIYIFDGTFSWSIALTHEEDEQGSRFCYFAYNKNDDDARQFAIER